MEFRPGDVRGKPRFDFTDLYGVECSVQESSLATDHAIWLGVNDADPKIMRSDADQLGIQPDDNPERTGWQRYHVPTQVAFKTRMHLNREQVRALLPMLQHFAETGELTKQ